MRKQEAVDLLKLYSMGSHKGWNEFLTACVRDQNINSLARMRYSLQAGMDDVAKKKLNDEKIIVFYLRLMRSIEQSAKQIIRIRHPMPGDDPRLAKLHLDKLEQKRKRDNELRQFFLKSSY